MLKISFDFDEFTNSVSNVKVIKSDSVKINSEQSWDLSVDDNKLVFSDELLETEYLLITELWIMKQLIQL